MSDENPSSVVLITIDCLRADHVGCYGYDRPTTPNIDSFAERATICNYSYANCPETKWALQSLHTGMWSGQIEGLGIPDVQGAALAEQFKESGFATGGFVHNGFLTRDYGYETGFDRFDDVHTFRTKQSLIRRIGGQINDAVDSELLRQYGFPLYRRIAVAKQSSDEAYRPDVTDQEVVANALQWITSQKNAGRRFFAWIHLMDAHTPYARWNGHLREIRGDTAVEHVIHPEEYVIEGEHPPQSVIDAYDAGIRSADEQVKKILHTLNDDSVIIITGDHGEEFGEYNPFHRASLHSSFEQVPIIIRAPGVERGSIDGYPIQHLDIPPTLVQTVRDEVPSQYGGQPLQQVDRDQDTPIYLSRGEAVGARVGDWKYIIPDPSSDGELYYSPYGVGDMTRFDEEPPLDRAEFVSLVRDHRNWMEENKISSGKQSLDEGTEDLSEAVRTNLKELGYIEK